MQTRAASADERSPRRASPSPGELIAPADGTYSIRVTSRLTDIELDTLRMWERRYGFPRPLRTSGGSRVYSGSDIESLKLIRRALQQGFRAGEVVGKDRDALIHLVRTTSGDARPEGADKRSVGGTGLPIGGASTKSTVDALLGALAREDVAAVRRGLRNASITFGPDGFIRDVVHPLIVRVGEMWAEGKLEVHHEHLLTGCLSAQLRIMMSAYDDQPHAPRVLLATLPNERHGLGLEMIQVRLAARHVTPVLVGTDTPADQVVKAARRHAANAVGLLVTHASDLRVTATEVRWVRARLPRSTALWIGGAAAADLKVVHDLVRIVSSWDDLDAAILALPWGPR